MLRDKAGTSLGFKPDGPDRQMAGRASRPRRGGIGPGRPSQALKRGASTLDKIGSDELNEAFAVQVCKCSRS